MNAVTVLRGFRVSVATLDAFLEANGIVETLGAPRYFHKHPDDDPVSVLLYNKIVKAGGPEDKNKFRVVTPLRRGVDLSRVAYVTYAWLCVYAHLELNLEQQLPEEIPKGFEALREGILSFAKEEPLDINKIPNEGKMGTYMVFTGDPYGTYFPQEMEDRTKTPQHCDVCHMTFDNRREAFALRQEHRIEVHGSKEGLGPLPEL
ncbi:hypothetical protein B0T10DRAFT_536619 [Thelonectria olida]|uniref:C2H2-type domain-containing protein n=1 Tax=Thelonectria olida TaxID=1576542 RepID=A0A9P8WAY9_9HYPO|nr:hypothetical protein B0T10DRAFT_536619 [Thelonectria olida]